MARWSVDLIGKRLQHLGTVVAANEKEAIKEAAKVFGINAARQSKIAVTKIADND
jgi:1,2-phenylacetyl-CoA epoxidase PaaB subunit